MNDNVKVFWLEPTDREHRYLRRYRASSEHVCSATDKGYCQAMFSLGEGDILYTKDGMIDARDPGPPHSDPRWPVKCDACGEAFADKDAHQLFTKQIYVRPDTGACYTLLDAPVGACWDAWWIHSRNRRGEKPLVPGVGTMIGDDGRSLVVRCPGNHDWMIDSRCSNCTKPEDNTHHCWVRHGKPEDGTLHVDKNGNTCSAGAGSIQTGNWHGFLRNGELVQ